jgi:transglutaminase-like putative cysteine protease
MAMMFEGTHTTTYRYSRPVFLEPHLLRLRPRYESMQRLRHFALHLEPQPAGLSESRDVEGNDVTLVWFAGATDILRVTSSLVVETQRGNPFDYIVTDPLADTLPFAYTEDLVQSVAPYCLSGEADESVAQFARSLADQVGRTTLPFLTILTQRIAEMMTYTVRETGEPQPAGVTLASRQGACRDLAVLFIETCRALGLAARFVSGYQEGTPRQEQRLHAWAEVYVPGGGWRGYDPTLGLAVADRHVTLAAGRTPQLAAPITGSFRGTGVSANLQADIRLRVSGCE